MAGRHDFPRGLEAIRAYAWSNRHIGVRVRYQMFKRGYFAGAFGRGRGPAESKPPVRAGVLFEWYAHGWRIGRDFRQDIKPPKPPRGRGPTGGKRIRLVA